MNELSELKLTNIILTNCFKVAFIIGNANTGQHQFGWHYNDNNPIGDISTKTGESWQSLFDDSYDYYYYYSDPNYFPNFPTCFIAQKRVKQFELICYLKYFPEDRSKNLDYDFLNIFQKSEKPSVFWAYCDLASLMNDYAQIHDIEKLQMLIKTVSSGKIQAHTNVWDFNWWERDYNIYVN